MDTAAIGAHARFLASDLLQGRRAGSPGARLAAEYIAATCQALGLEEVRDSYFQSVPLVESAIRSGTLTVTTNAGRWVFVSPRDFVADLGSAASLTGFDGPAVFVENPLAPSVDIRGAVVVTEEIGDRAALDTLEARGAVGLVLAVADGRRHDLYVRSRGETRLTLADGTVGSSLLRSLPTVVAGPAIASVILGPGAPRDARVELTLDVVRTSTPDRNVACLQPGSDPRARDTAIVFTAHFDHLGVGLPDARGDSVYNGFSDNAAGVAMVLGIAAATRRAERAPRHSMLFLFFTAEEHGLLGSDYYTAQPLWPLDRTRAVINLDAGAPPAPPSSWRLAGTVGSELAHLAVDVALARGWSATVTPATPNSDHFPFLRAGVPAVFVIPGPGPYEGMSMDSSRALKAKWDAYHEPGDEWSPVFPLAGLARYAEYAWLIGAALDRHLTDGGERSRWRGRGRR
ncbi:MAG TPA: M28 family peptidase [Gemmatimonadales bacterium]|nr:M28 family peptidase [Gemmatimonadales bacterium]